MKDFREQNYYELLDIKPHASQKELETSYERARRFFSSDSVATYALFQPDELVLLRRRIEEAYRVLADPERRQRYDKEMIRLQGEGWPEAEAAQVAETAEADSREAEGKEDANGEKTQLALVPEKEAGPEASGPKPENAEGETAESLQTTEKEEDEAGPEEEEQGRERKESQEAVAIDENPATAAEAGPETVPDDDQAEAAEATAQTTLESPARPEEPPPTMPPVDEDTQFTGDLIRRIREAKGISLEKVADKTKISIYYLKNIEADNYDELPARVYVRGYLKQLAEILGLDPARTADSFLGMLEKPEAEEEE